MSDRWPPTTVWAVPALTVLMAACGEDGENNDTLLTGLSGLVIAAILIWLAVRYIGKRS